MVSKSVSVPSLSLSLSTKDSTDLRANTQVCLFGPPVLALRPLLRALPRLSDEELLPHIGRVVQGKKYSHDGLGGAEGIKLNGKSGPMVSIGG